MARLSKRDVLQLGAAVAAAGDDLAANRAALAVPLAVLTGLPYGPDGTGWAALVDAAAARGGWTTGRADALRAAAPTTAPSGPDDGPRHGTEHGPQHRPDHAQVFNALWDTVAELIERLELAPDVPRPA